MEEDITEKHENINIKKAWVDASVEEFGRCLPGMIILTSESEVSDVKLMLERVLNDTWEQAQKPLIAVLMGKMIDEET